MHQTKIIMENQANSQLKQSLIYGGILGLAAVVVSVVAYMLGMADNRGVQWINYLVEIVFIALGVKNFRRSALRRAYLLRKGPGYGFS